jgi:hypothetical protein
MGRPCSAALFGLLLALLACGEERPAAVAPAAAPGIEAAVAALPAWPRISARVGTLDFAAAQRVALDANLEVVEVPAVAGRAAAGVVVALRREGGTAPLRPVAVAALPELTLLDGLVPTSEEFPTTKARRLIVLLDGLLRSLQGGGGPPPQEFTSEEGPPLDGGDWPAFVTEPPPEGRARSVSIATFEVLAQAPFALLAATRLSFVDLAIDDELGIVPGLVEPAREIDCLVLFRPLAPTVAGTTWGVAWIMEVGEVVGGS